MTIFDSDSNDKNDERRFTQFVAELTAVGHSVSAMYEGIIVSLEPQVQRVIEAGSKDVFEIEHLLDQLLDVCDDERALSLYRSLCRHYWTISQTNTAFYVNAYRSMWEESDESNSSN